MNVSILWCVFVGSQCLILLLNLYSLPDRSTWKITAVIEGEVENVGTKKAETKNKHCVTV